MLFRAFLVPLGLAEVLWPRRVVDFWMDLAAVRGQEVELRPWVYAAARVEGLLLLVWVLASLGRE